MIELPNYIGDKLAGWHGSMYDPVYAVGSCVRAGEPVDEESIRDAINQLKRSASACDAEGLDEAMELIDELEQILSDTIVAKRAAIIGGMARAFFVDDWARDNDPGGVELMGVAPATSEHAKKFAADFTKKVEAANGKNLIALFNDACEADADVAFTNNQEARNFGHYLAMQAMGHGVSWFDDHADFEIEIPYMEYFV